ncbi:tRNA-dihydrouridine(47) synthase [Penicillium chermesinum]|uniref:tRNA-dihydrouridine(47) synthase [NAD(P)(+)] n=1 Tax=Penicillium chermesinum TaxID=63820 RepID=A0A9W9PI32_9EURO|nr:tRNA-dihydrouridine(47) synthase [Penicillium chermesinum]KAJ5247109.1 tRNA-dihydrouridine(47) synthase [Penicillium chermesinum]
MDSSLAQGLADKDLDKKQHSLNGSNANDEPPTKKARLDPSSEMDGSERPPRESGIAPIKKEYIPPSILLNPKQPAIDETNADDAAEEASHIEREGESGGKKDKKKKKPTGQNTNRSFGSSRDAKALCLSRAFSPEFSPKECTYGDKCRMEHDLRVYLTEHKRENLTTFNNLCPVWDTFGEVSLRVEVPPEDGKKELILLEDDERKARYKPRVPFASEDGLVNIISAEDKLALSRKRDELTRANAVTQWLNTVSKELEREMQGRGEQKEGEDTPTNDADEAKEVREEQRATYTEPPFLPSEKRRIYFGPETPTLAPLTTQGNLPFRRLCTDLGAQFTYSEMALSLPLIQGQKSEWTLLKAHESEMLPPTITSGENVVQGYDNSKDMKFGAQIAGNKPWQVLKATEALSKYTPNLRVIDLNCGCPIELLFREGAGSALLDHQSKLEKMLRGMNMVSQEIPITVKIRMGTKDNSPTAQKLIERLVMGGHESNRLEVGPPGVAAITLHGRSRQQRYTRQADWSYIAECSALIKRMNETNASITDTIRQPDARYLPNGGKTYFLGNGDCISHIDYDEHIRNAGVDSVMVGRGALIKPWIFEEIQTGQYLDKSATERLAYVEKFAKYGLEAWGSDEYGIGTTRRFLLEWLSFTYRYVPLGILEYLPPRINDRPRAWRGRNELETLMGSGNYKDWIKITEMFLGPAHPDFKFEPKHKSNAYEAEG